MKISQWLNSAGKYLKERHSGAGRIDAEAILGHLTGRDRASQYRDGDVEISPSLQDTLWGLIERRAAGEPLAYITGKKEFFGLDFVVNPAVLIPRPETELLVEKAIEIIKRTPNLAGSEKTGPVIVDVGTGCGTIAVSLAASLTSATIFAIDLSPEALRVAEQNAVSRGVVHRVSFLQGDLLEPLVGLSQGGHIDIIAANLPYIPSADIPHLMADVRDYEPSLALDGGGDGLDLYRRLAPEAFKMLSPGGHLLMEIGPGQGAAMRQILGTTWILEILDDLASRERLVIAKKH
ncbi:MAG: peptide chain release factor N(5)-glutamine methyltransferase [Desulfocucumaceae bacterium]